MAWLPSKLCTWIVKVSDQAVMYGQVNTDLFLQQQSPQSLVLPELHPGHVHMCLHWLQEREMLLRTELVALRSLPPETCQPLRQEVGIATYHLHSRSLQ